VTNQTLGSLQCELRRFGDQHCWTPAFSTRQLRCSTGHSTDWILGRHCNRDDCHRLYDMTHVQSVAGWSIPASALKPATCEHTGVSAGKQHPKSPRNPTMDRQWGSALPQECSTPHPHCHHVVCTPSSVKHHTRSVTHQHLSRLGGLDVHGCREAQRTAMSLGTCCLYSCACSNAAASASTRASAPGGPTICSPTRKPAQHNRMRSTPVTAAAPESSTSAHGWCCALTGVA
jgi:hypothetical protein